VEGYGVDASRDVFPAYMTFRLIGTFKESQMIGNVLEKVFTDGFKEGD
jgi:hypothetical protein